MHAYVQSVWHINADEADCEPVCIEQVSVQVQMVDLPEMLA